MEAKTGHAFELRSTDGYPLAATIHGRTEHPRAAVVVNSATGVKRKFYAKYASFLADSGLPTLTYDYRGIGGSRPPTLRGFNATMRDWAEKDANSAIEWVVQELKPSRVLLVGHSAGGQLLGLTPNNGRVHAMLAVGAQSGYWRYWKAAEQPLMAALWYVAMPGLSRLFSYFPAKALRLHEDLPKGVALEWARWCRNPNYIVDEAGRPIREGFESFTGAIRSYSFEDDFFAPRAAVEALIHWYTRAPKEWIHVVPSSLGVKSIGHFGMFREEFRDTLWAETGKWLDEQAGR